MKDVEWVEMDEKAVSNIRLNLGDKVIHNILEAKTAKEVQEKLEGLYMRKNPTNNLFVKKQLYNLHINEGLDLLEHLNIFNMLNTQLSSFGVNFEDEDKVLLLLASLPTHFDHIVTTLMYGKETVVLDEVTSALLSLVKMKQERDGSQADGLIVKSKLSNRGRSESRSNGNRSQSRSRTKKYVECFYCHKKWHYKNQCKELKCIQRRRRIKKPLESTSVVEETSDDVEVGVDLLSVSLGNNFLLESWVLDLACTYHMTPKKDWFDTYKPFNGGMVQMGNDATCLVIKNGNGLGFCIPIPDLRAKTRDLDLARLLIGFFFGAQTHPVQLLGPKSGPTIFF